MGWMSHGFPANPARFHGLTSWRESGCPGTDRIRALREEGTGHPGRVAAAQSGSDRSPHPPPPNNRRDPWLGASSADHEGAHSWESRTPGLQLFQLHSRGAG